MTEITVPEPMNPHFDFNLLGEAHLGNPEAMKKIASLIPPRIWPSGIKPSYSFGERFCYFCAGVSLPPKEGSLW